MVVLCAAAAGSLGLVRSVHQAGLDGLDRPLNVFFRLYTAHEPLSVVLILLLGPLLLLTLRGASRPPEGRGGSARRTGVLAAATAATGIGAAGAGTWLVQHGYPLAMDEYMADFQAEILAAGRTVAALPPDWAPLGHALAPIFAVYDPESGRWWSSYLPVYAAMRGLLGVAGLRPLTNTVLGLLTLLVLWRAARLLWPSRPAAGPVAVTLLASSPQFVVTAMTAYAMPAHALLNATWLWAYLAGGRGALAALPLVSALAFGLHNVVPHTLFVAPFLVSLARRGPRAGAAGVVGGVLAALLFWAHRSSAAFEGIVSLVGLDGGPPLVLGMPNLHDLRVHAMNASMVLSWQSLGLVFLAALALADRRRWPPALRDLAAGVVLTFGFYLALRGNQGHGWGYRYIFPALPGLALLGAAGWLHVEEAFGWRRAYRLLLLSSALALLVQLPVRAVQVEGFVRPFAAASRHLAASAEEVVVIDWRDHWYSQDLVRNDPWLRARIKILFADRLDAAAVQRLDASGRTIRLVRPGDLVPFGLYATRRPPG
jgi:hypothetical protein